MLFQQSISHETRFFPNILNYFLRKYLRFGRKKTSSKTHVICFWIGSLNKNIIKDVFKLENRGWPKVDWGKGACWLRTPRGHLKAILDNFDILNQTKRITWGRFFYKRHMQFQAHLSQVGLSKSSYDHYFYLS